MKIGIFHYKIASTDGVSLEIEKRINILESLGHTVVVVGGKFDKPIPQKYYALKDFDIDDQINRTLINQTIKDEKIEQIPFQKIFNERKGLVENELNNIFESEKFDLVIVHNIFSLPLLIWSAYALKNTIEKFNVRTICVNHDFYFERDYFTNSSNADLPKILENTFPTPSEVRHEVINTIASKRLYEIHKISSTVLGDYLDFNHQKTGIDDYNSDFLEHFGIEKNDLVVLQATRIVPRKAIEMSILLTAYINKKLPNYIGQTFNGKTITADSKAVLIFSNYPHHIDSETYFTDLVEYAKKLNVKTVNAFERISPARNISDDGKKIYSFWDPYYFADLVTYPSVLEGFGNQFLEAVYFNKLIALFEYEVFKEDIKKDGYFYVCMDEKWNKENRFYNFSDEKLLSAADHLLRILGNPNLLKEITEYNFNSAKSKHDLSILREYISREYFSNLPDSEILPASSTAATTTAT